MSRFDNLVGAKKEPENPLNNLIKVSGSFQCQTCNECVATALYNPENAELGWKCTKGHISVIKGLDL